MLDDEFKKIRSYIMRQEKVSTSHIQRKFGIGYPKAFRIIEQLEEDGIISSRDKHGFRIVIRRIGVWNI